MKTETEYLIFEELEDKDLRITATPEGKLEIRDLLLEGKSHEDIWERLTEYGKCNSGYQCIPPEVVSALTSSIILGTDIEYVNEEDGEVSTNYYGIKEVDKIWWFPNYMVQNELEMLLKDEKLIASWGLID